MSPLSSAFIAPPELLKALEPHATPVDPSAIRILFYEGDSPVGVYIVKNGFAKLTSTAGAGGGLSILAGTGSLLGLPAVVGSKGYSLRAEALDNAEITFVSGEDFINLMQSEPQLSFLVLRVLAEEVRFARETLTSI